jgi:hypothetical protein
MGRGISIGVLVIALLVIVAVIYSCNPTANPSNVRPSGDISAVVDYGHGVYYFPYKGQEFGNAISVFIGSRPEIEYIGSTGDGNGAYGRDQGYFVFFRQKQ